MVFNLETGHVSPQLHVVFDNKFSAVTFMMEGTMPPNWTYLVQNISQIGAPENIDLYDTWFSPYIEDDLR